MLEGSRWFKKFYKDCKKMSPHIDFVRIKHGFYRIYWTGGGEPAYMHEVYKWMPMVGYDIEERDPRFDSHTYYQSMEHKDDLTLKIKNFVEGYYDSIGTMKRRVRMFKNDKEFYQTATKAYRGMKVK